MKQVRVAFGGSGFLGGIHAGAACAFMEAGVSIIEASGTSGGSILSALLAAGKSVAEIKEIAVAPVPSDIMSLQPFGALWRWAINDGEVLRKWLLDTIGNTTFDQAKIPITIVASDVVDQRSVVFSKTRTPAMLLADACRMSASVPVVWEPVTYHGLTVADGGMACNIPTDKLIYDGVRRIGIQVQDGNVSHKPVNTLLGYAIGCIGTMLNSNEGNLVAWAKQTGATIVPVSAKPYGFLDANLSRAAKQDLFDRGYNAVHALLMNQS